MIRILIAVLALGSAAHAGESAGFPFGIYDKAEIAPGSAGWHAYYAKLFDLLEKNGIDTILTLPYTRPEHSLEVLDEAQRHGIRVILGTGNPQNRNWDFAGPGYPFHRVYRHPAVIAYKYGDEPKDARQLPALESEYSTLRRHYRLPIVTALGGEGMDFSAGDFPLSLWEVLDSEIRFARHYPIRRTYDLAQGYPQKMKMPFAAWAQKMEESSPRPWWYIAQTFGSGVDKSEASYWRLPTATELSAMIHIALAYGARGVVGYALQDHQNFLGLVDADLKPRKARDGSVPLARYAQLAALVHAQEPLLLRHERADFACTVSDREIVAVPRRDPSTGARYVYVVNQNAEHAVLFEVRLPNAIERLMLDAGEGRLYRLEGGALSRQF